MPTQPRRDGRAAEGDGLLNRYTGYYPVSRVRIPLSPLHLTQPLRTLEFPVFARAAGVFGEHLSRICPEIPGPHPV